jgi:signal transduction histidine kinase/CheY-like chemotaxis protein
MSKPSASPKSELRISSRPVIVALMALGLAFVLLGDFQPDPSKWLPIDLCALLLFTASVIALPLERWKPWASRWLATLTLIAMVHLVNMLLGIPGSLTLVAIPITLAAPLISLPAATITAVGESLLLVVLLRYPGAGLSLPTVAVTLIAIWAMLGIVHTMYRPMRQLSKYLEEYFEHTQRFLEEARDRKAELEQALESLAHANRQLALANERTAALRMIAEEAQRAKTAFVANVSHEFRTPLNMIIGLVDLMVETPEIYTTVLSPEMREDLRVVHRNCEHLSNMINDVLDLTRMEAGRLTLHRERVDLEEVIDSSVAAVRPLLEKKHLALQVTIPNDLPKIYCDHTRIQQVILNLVSNAARFTERGGITVEVAQQDLHIVVSVTDTGPGIAPEDAERIFEPFSQGSSELWRDKKGSGLGLSISQQFVKLHRGRMWLESKLGIGTSFFFTLPISPPLEPVGSPGHRIREDWVWRERTFRTEQAVSDDQLAKRRVVVCDETGSLYSELTHCSDEVEFVDTREPTQAAGELRRSAAHAVMLNLATSADPWPLVETLKQQAPGTPIIGCSVPQPTERAIGAGALGYLIKPVTRSKLEEAIQMADRPVRRVLVVDDDPDVLQLFSRMLHVYDDTLEIVTASDGEQALDQLHRLPPDLMLLDIVMPDMDGWQILEAMRQDKGIEDIPTFFVSAQDPADQPLVSKFLLVTMDEGLSLSKLLRCSLETSALLLEPERGLDLAPV